MTYLSKMLASVHSTAIYKNSKIAGDCTSLIYYRGYQIRVKYILCGLQTVVKYR